MFHYDVMKNPAALIDTGTSRYCVHGVGVIRDGDRVWLASTEGHAMILVDAAYYAQDLVALEDKDTPVLDPEALATAKGSVRKKFGSRVPLELSAGAVVAVNKSGSKVSFPFVEARFPRVLECVPKGVRGTKVTLSIDTGLLLKLAKGLGETKLKLTLDVDADGCVRLPVVCRPVVGLRQSAEDASFGIIMPVDAGWGKKK